MKMLISIALCFILSMITSLLFPDFMPGGGAVSTLYTVSGIMFSIGMSLVVTSSAAGVKNERIRKGIRKEIYIVRNHFIECFAITSIMFILLYSAINKKFVFPFSDYLIIKYSHLLVFIIAYSIIYFVLNFLAIQRLNVQIEDALNDSEKKDY